MATVWVVRTGREQRLFGDDEATARAFAKRSGGEVRSIEVSDDYGYEPGEEDDDQSACDLCQEDAPIGDLIYVWDPDVQLSFQAHPGCAAERGYEV